MTPTTTPRSGARKQKDRKKIDASYKTIRHLPECVLKIEAESKPIPAAFPITNSADKAMACSNSGLVSISSGRLVKPDLSRSKLTASEKTNKATWTETAAHLAHMTLPDMIDCGPCSKKLGKNRFVPRCTHAKTTLQVRHMEGIYAKRARNNYSRSHTPLSSPLTISSLKLSASTIIAAPQTGSICIKHSVPF